MQYKINISEYGTGAKLLLLKIGVVDDWTLKFFIRK